MKQYQAPETAIQEITVSASILAISEGLDVFGVSYHPQGQIMGD